jgi:hypothetical protein
MTWQPTAIVLIVEHRECGCGHTYECPNHVPMLQVTRQRTETAVQRKFLSIPTNEPGIVASLPRELKHVHTTVASCHNCWTVTDPAQLDLWPAPPATPGDAPYRHLGRRGEESPRPRGARAVPVLSLDEIFG